MPREIVSHWCLTLLLLTGRWEKEDLSAATGVPLDLLNDYLEERRGLTRGALAAMIAALRLTSEDLVDLYPKLLRVSNRRRRVRSWEEYQAEKKRIVERHSQWLGLELASILASPEIDIDSPGVVPLRKSIRAARGHWGRLFTDLLVLISEEWEAKWRPHEEDRALGPKLWKRLEPRWRAKPYVAALEVSKWRHWSLYLHLCSVSREAASRNPVEAVALMKLALDLAGSSLPRPAPWRAHVLATLWAHMAYAQRCLGEPREAAKALERARSFWEEGCACDPDLLAMCPALDVEAALRLAAGPEEPESLARASGKAG